MNSKVKFSDTAESIHSKFSFSAHAPLTIIEIDLNGIILYANYSFQGYAKDKIIGKQFLDFVEEKFHPIVQSILQKMLTEQVNKVVNYHVIWVIV